MEHLHEEIRKELHKEPVICPSCKKEYITNFYREFALRDYYLFLVFKECRSCGHCWITETKVK